MAKTAMAVIESEAMAATSQPMTILEIAAKAQADVTERAAASQTTMQEVGQLLAQVADMEADGRHNAREIRDLASQGAKRLYQGRAQGLFSNEQITAVLGDKFGYKEKGEGADKTRPVPAGHKDASKTPFGEGEAIRKRVVRAVDAHRFVMSDGEDATSFFEGMNVETIKGVLADIDGGLSIYSAYDDFTAIRKAGNPTLDAAFRPETIEKQAKRLTESDMAEGLRNNPLLIIAYKGLMEQIEQLLNSPAEAGDIAF